MERWAEFELRCEQWLKDRFPEIAHCFILQGGADATVSDILVAIPGSEPFYIECKMPYRARYGQRVLEEKIITEEGSANLVEDEVFVDGKEYVLKNNDSYAFSRLVDYINSQHHLGDESLEDEYSEPEELFFDGTESEQLFLAEIACGYYQEKGVDALMTGRKSGAGYCIVPIDAYELAYLINFTYGIRDYRSGSTPCSARDEKAVRDILAKDYGIRQDDIVRMRACYRGGNYKSRLLIFNRDYYENNLRLLTNDTFCTSGEYEYKLRERDEMYTMDGEAICNVWEIVRRSPNSSQTLFLIGCMKRDEEVGTEFIRQSIVDFDYFVEPDWADEVHGGENVLDWNGRLYS